MSILQSTLPIKSGERNDAIMKLARGIKFNAGMKDEKIDRLREIVRQWHTRALPVIDTKSFTETWRDFLHAFETAKHPLGRSVVDVAAARVEPESIPEIAADYDDEPTRKLIALCAALATVNGGERFFLSSHDAAPRIGVKQMACWRILRMLCRDGVIECLERGNERRATRYRWIGGGDVDKCFAKCCTTFRETLIQQGGAE
jgi:hypothetical protein